MGFILSKFYYGKSKEIILTQDETVILQIKQCRDKIKGYVKKLERDVCLNKEKAKEMLKKNEREKAKLFLNKSKVCSKYIENYQNQLNIIEDQITNIQMTKQQRETLDVLQRGNQVLRELQKEVNLERLENISEEMNELKQSQEEVANFLKNYKIDSQDFDAEVDRDLENLMNEAKDKNDQKIIDKQFDSIVKEDFNRKVKKEERKAVVMN